MKHTLKSFKDSFSSVPRGTYRFHVLAGRKNYRVAFYYNDLYKGTFDIRYVNFYEGVLYLHNVGFTIECNDCRSVKFGGDVLNFILR